MGMPSFFSFIFFASRRFVEKRIKIYVVLDSTVPYAWAQGPICRMVACRWSATDMMGSIPQEYRSVLATSKPLWGIILRQLVVFFSFCYSVRLWSISPSYQGGSHFLFLIFSLYSFFHFLFYNPFLIFFNLSFFNFFFNIFLSPFLF